TSFCPGSELPQAVSPSASPAHRVRASSLRFIASLLPFSAFVPPQGPNSAAHRSVATGKGGLAQLIPEVQGHGVSVQGAGEGIVTARLHSHGIGGVELAVLPPVLSLGLNPLSHGGAQLA